MLKKEAKWLILADTLNCEREMYFIFEHKIKDIQTKWYLFSFSNVLNNSYLTGCIKSDILSVLNQKCWTNLKFKINLMYKSFF